MLKEEEAGRDWTVDRSAPEVAAGFYRGVCMPYLIAPWPAAFRSSTYKQDRSRLQGVFMVATVIGHTPPAAVQGVFSNILPREGVEIWPLRRDRRNAHDSPLF